MPLDTRPRLERQESQLEGGGVLIVGRCLSRAQRTSTNCRKNEGVVEGIMQHLL